MDTILSTADMTPAERVIATFEKQRMDKVAVFHSGFSSQVGSVLLGRESYSGGGINQWREATATWDGPDAHAEFVERTTRDTYDLARLAKTDLIRIAYWRMPAKPAQKIDDLTFLYGDPDGDYTVRQLSAETELYQIIDQRNSKAPQTVDDLEVLVESMERGVENHHPTAASFTAAMQAYEVFAPEREIPTGGYGLSVPNTSQIWLEAIALRPDLVSRMLETQCLRAIATIRAQKDLPLRVIMGGGDFCGNHGPNYSPRFFHEEMLPRLQRMSAAAHECDMYTVFATDGDTWPVGDDLWGASGTDAAHEIDCLAGMDLRKMRAAYPNLTCFGNISTITLHQGTKEEVVAQTRENCEAALDLGGILAGVSNQIPPGTPIENVLAMLETIEEYH
ncbi:MAG: hypothetical protein KAI66_07060 [Lentisphaeria bacterium]|nr:hypothetical protein [Lentisphaeria bacterium]